jgi:multidrug efflux pump subunit AcrA (membrane-fusion protein)
MRTLRRSIGRWLGVAVGVLALSAGAHEGHDDAPGTSAASAAPTGSVVVSSQARENLGLQLSEAEIRPMETTLGVIGEIETIPDRAGAVTSRIAGRVSWIGFAEGEFVKKGQPVVEVESLQLGDPPPRARYGAPLSGWVTDRHVTLGSSVEPNAHLLELADLNEVLAVGQLFEGQIGRVHVQQAVRVRVASYPDTTFEGKVERLGSALDPTTRSLPFYVRVRNPEGKLLPRMRAELSVVVERSDAALAIPRSAVLGDFGNEFVFVEQDAERGTFQRTPIVRGIADDQFVEAIEGLLPGDRVVTVGNYSLQFLPPMQAEPHEDVATDTAESGGHASEGASLLGYALAFALGSIATLIALGIFRGFFTDRRVGGRRHAQPMD